MESVETRIGVLANWGILDALSPFPRSDSVSMFAASDSDKDAMSKIENYRGTVSPHVACWILYRRLLSRSNIYTGTTVELRVWHCSRLLVRTCSCKLAMTCPITASILRLLTPFE